MGLYYFFAVDTVNGNLDYKKLIKKSNLFNMKQFKATIIDYRTWILFVVYMICFGVEITVITYFQIYFIEQFNLNPTTAGLFVFMFSCLNLFARSAGGYGSDILYRRYGIQGRVYTLFIVLILESIFLFLFCFGGFSLGYSVVILLIFSFYVQCAEGITYAIVPFVRIGNGGIGPIYGIVAAGGNFGSFLFSTTIFLATPNSKNIITYQQGFIILSIFIFIGSFLTLKLKFTQKEIRAADDLLTSFLKNHHEKIYGDGNDNNNNNNNNNNEKKNKTKKHHHLHTSLSYGQTEITSTKIISDSINNNDDQQNIQQTFNKVNVRISIDHYNSATDQEENIDTITPGIDTITPQVITPSDNYGIVTPQINPTIGNGGKSTTTSKMTFVIH